MRLILQVLNAASLVLLTGAVFSSIAPVQGADWWWAFFAVTLLLAGAIGYAQPQVRGTEVPAADPKAPPRPTPEAQPPLPLAPGYYNPVLNGDAIEFAMRGFEQDFRCKMSIEEARVLSDDLAALDTPSTTPVPSGAFIADPSKDAP